MRNRGFTPGQLAIVMSFTLGVVACGGSAPPTANPSASPVQHGKLTIKSDVRTYRVFRPTSLDPKQAAPLVISLHPCPPGANGDGQATFTHFDDQAVAGGFVAAYPDAVPCWNDGSGHGPRIDDVGFINRLIDELTAKYSINKKRVFIVGISIGALMAYWLACQLAPKIAAIAAVSGTMPVDDCQPAAPISVLAMNGTEDSLFPYEGGGPLNFKPAVAVIEGWAKRDGCVGTPIQSQNGITKTSLWNQCKGGAMVRLDTVLGGHQTWFGSPFDPVPGEPDTNTVVWDFFSKVGSKT